MARQYKCVYCGELIAETENKIPVKSRYAHERCFNVSLKATDKKQKEAKQKKLAERKNTSETARKSTKPVQELREGLTEEEYQEKKKLFNKIREIQGSEELTAKTYALVDNYIKKYNFTYLGMYQALVYFYEIKENPCSEDCVGIIPYCYDESQKELEQIQIAQEKNKQLSGNLGSMYQKKVINISKMFDKRGKSNKMIDIESL